ncbi:MAG: hypothetical protein RIB32_02760 [Phycisphaerales bacterium]
MPNTRVRYRRARNLAAAGCAATLLLTGTLGVASAGHCGVERSGWNAGRGHGGVVQWGPGRRAPRNWNAGTLHIDGHCFNISRHGFEREIIRALRRCGYCAEIRRFCGGVRIRIDGCPSIRWSSACYSARIRHGARGVTLTLRARH